MNNRKLYAEVGSATIVVIVGVALILAVVVGLLVFSKKTDKRASQASSSGSIAHSEKAIAQNAQRKNDAASLASGVAEFLNNNTARFPTGWQRGKLSGAQGTTETSAQLYVYGAVAFASGEQSPLQQDTLRLVTHASCVSGGGTTGTTDPTTFAVQYSQLTDTGEVRPECVDS